MKLFHNSQNSCWREPFGAAAIGSSVTLRLDAEDRFSALSGLSVYLVTSFNGTEREIPMLRAPEKQAAVSGGYGEPRKDLSESCLPEENTLFRFEVTLDLEQSPGVLWYYFKVSSSAGTLYYGNNSALLGGAGQSYERDPLPYQITVYRQDHVPSWFREAVVYQIFPDRFARSPDWRELEERAQREYYGAFGSSLSGADVPEKTLKSPRGEGEEDDARKADLKAGGADAGKDSGEESASRGVDLQNTDFFRPERSVQENWDDLPAYPRTENGNVAEWIFAGGTLDGIKSKLGYLADLGITCIYLNPIFSAASNHRYDTADYMRIDAALGDEESFSSLCREAASLGIRIILDGVFNHTGADSIYFNLFARKGALGACQGEESPYFDWYTFKDGKYSSWWGVRDLPDINELCGSYKKFIYEDSGSVVRKWMRLGAAGWRIDVADELPDEFIEGIRAAMKEENKDSVLLGEVWDDATNKISYGRLKKYFLGDELQSVMNYPFRDASLDFMRGNIDPGKYAARLMSLKENYPKENFFSSLNLIGSHDRDRALTVLSDAVFEAEKLIEARNEPEEAVKDLMEKSRLCRQDAVKACFSIPEDKLRLAKNRLKALSLLQFFMPGVPCIYYGDEAGMSGFTDPYCRGSFPWGRRDSELTEHFKMLCRLRKDNPVLIDGDFLPSAAAEHVICFERFNDACHMWLFVNRGIFERQEVFCQGEKFTLPPLGWKIIKTSK